MKEFVTISSLVGALMLFSIYPALLSTTDMIPLSRLLGPPSEKEDDVFKRIPEMRRFLKMIIKVKPSFEIPPSAPDPRFRLTIPITPGSMTPATPARSPSDYGSPLSGYGRSPIGRSSLRSAGSLSPGSDVSPTGAAMRRKQYTQGRSGAIPPTSTLVRQTWPSSRARPLLRERSRSHGGSSSPHRPAHAALSNKIPALCLTQQFVSTEVNMSTTSGPVDLSPITEGAETFEGVPTDLSATFSALHIAKVAGHSRADLPQAPTDAGSDEDPFMGTNGPSLVLTRATPSPDVSPSPSPSFTYGGIDHKVPDEGIQLSPARQQLNRSSSRSSDIIVGQTNAITQPCRVNKVASTRRTEDNDYYRELLRPHTPKDAIDTNVDHPHPLAASPSPLSRLRLPIRAQTQTPVQSRTCNHTERSSPRHLTPRPSPCHEPAAQARPRRAAVAPGPSRSSKFKPRTDLRTLTHPGLASFRGTMSSTARKIRNKLFATLAASKPRSPSGSGMIFVQVQRQAHLDGGEGGHMAHDRGTGGNPTRPDRNAHANLDHTSCMGPAAAHGIPEPHGRKWNEVRPASVHPECACRTPQ